MKKLLLSAVIALAGTLCVSAETVTLWQTGETALEGDGTVAAAYSTGLVIAPEKFAEAKAGDRINIYTTCDVWNELYLKDFAKKQIYHSTAISGGKSTEVLTNFQLNLIKDGGFRIDAAKPLTITKVELEKGAFTGDFANAIWIGKQSYTSGWGGTIIRLCPALGALVKEGDTFRVTYTKDADKTAVMVNYVNSENKLTDYYPQWVYDETGAEFVVKDDFANLLSQNNKGLAVKGASITVSQVDLKKAGSSAIETVIGDNTPGNVDVYTITGSVVRKNVPVDEATVGLAPGFYIVGGKKTIVR